MEIAKCGKYRIFRIANPVNNPMQGREWLITEGGAGYVLAYRMHRLCSKWRVDARKKIPEANVTCYIKGHLALLQRYLGDLSEFVLPTMGCGMRRVVAFGEVLLGQMV